MVITDPIADMLIRIKNGYLSRKTEVVLPSSRIKESLADLLEKEGFIAKQQTRFIAGKKMAKDGGFKQLVLELKYDHKEPAMTDVRRVSRPGLRIYANKNNLPRVLGGLGTAIISTPQGLLTDKQARKKNLGGEVICKIW